MGQARDFEDDLALSHSKRYEAIWESVYRNAFPTFVNMTGYPQDGEHQRSGIDRSIQLENGKQVLVDEKWRTKAYDDILLEYMSNAERNTPGWVVKPLRADYIAYAIGPMGVCYLLPVLQLQAAWSRFSSDWLSEYGTREARTRLRNGDVYTTLNCPVPHKILYTAMGNLLRQHFPPEPSC